MINKKIQILHVLSGMNRGGAETWLMHVLRNMNRDRFHFDFLTNKTEQCAYDEEVRKIGCRIIPCLDPHQPWKYAWNFIRLVREQGPYDVVHSHLHHYSGFVCWLARLAGIQMIIAHSHNDIEPKESGAGIGRKMYLHVMEWLVKKNATHGLACSGKAAQSLFGDNWHTDRKWRVLYYGIDLEPFAADTDKNEIRSELGIPVDAFVIGHVGSFSKQKNHTFLLDIIAATVQKDLKNYALFVGDGQLRNEIKEKAQTLGIEKHIIFAGLRSDIPRIMRSMDVFVFPSLYEGLGIVLIEAQASGIPCVIADGIPDDADVIQELVTRLSLTDRAEKWAEKIAEIKMCKTGLQQKLALEKVKSSHFNIHKSVRELEAFYAGNVSKNL